MINNINGLFALFSSKLTLSLETLLSPVPPWLQGRGGSASRADESFWGRVVHLKWAVVFKMSEADAGKFGIQQRAC